MPCCPAVIDLLEQFLGSGFDKETAIRLIHSSMLLQTEGQSSATVDLCMADLYTGDCEFLKIGASTTFLKRGRLYRHGVRWRDGCPAADGCGGDDQRLSSAK